MKAKTTKERLHEPDRTGDYAGKGFLQKRRKRIKEAIEKARKVPTGKKPIEINEEYGL